MSVDPRPLATTTIKSSQISWYQTIAELEEYVLIDSRKAWVRVYRRNGFKLETAPAVFANDIALSSLDVSHSLAAIYEDVDFGRNVRMSTR